MHDADTWNSPSRLHWSNCSVLFGGRHHQSFARSNNAATELAERKSLARSARTGDHCLEGFSGCACLCVMRGYTNGFTSAEGGRVFAA
jgi:hypothetical protein